jgi:hypothetical protein
MVRCEDPPIEVHHVAVAVSAPAATAATAAEGIPPAGSMVGRRWGGGGDGGTHETEGLTAPGSHPEPFQAVAMPANEMQRGAELTRGTSWRKGKSNTPKAH